MKLLNILNVVVLNVVVIFLLGLLSSYNVLAEPTGPSNIDVISSSRFPVSTASNTSAIAGNVTELNFQSNSVTNTWQGYFGNISGSVKLGDSNNNTLYDWTSASPTGEIYATRNSSTPSWVNVTCANQTNIDYEDAALNVNQTADQDSVNATFLNITFNTFFVGSLNINSTQDCRAINLHNSSGLPTTDFQEVLLHDGANLIYAAIISQDANGFDNRTHDFEMLVGEDGHNGNVDPTPYYFYVELG